MCCNTFVLFNTYGENDKINEHISNISTCFSCTSLNNKFFDQRKYMSVSIQIGPIFLPDPGFFSSDGSDQDPTTCSAVGFIPY